MIRVVDSIMGSGKSTWARDYINAHPEKRFLYIIPFLNEVNKVLVQCNGLSFFQPEDTISKHADAIRLLKEGANIVSTHALFKNLNLTRSVMEEIKKQDYTLIMDEVLETIEIVHLSKHDTTSLIKQYTDVDENGIVHWIAPEYRGVFDPIKAMAKSGTLRYYKNSVLMWQFPIQTLCAFRDVYILTFLFEASHLRYDLVLNGIQYQYYHIQNGELLDGRENLKKKKMGFRKLLNVCDLPKLNAIGQGETDLSKSWWKKLKQNDRGKKAKNNTRTFFETICHAHSDDAMWSCFTENQKMLTPKGYLKAFCACNARATNEYGNRNCLAYLINVYEQPYILQWYKERNIEIDQSWYALSQLLQWIWRSAIRNGKAVRLYLPSARMRRILQSWLNDDEEIEWAA